MWFLNKKKFISQIYRSLTETTVMGTKRKRRRSDSILCQNPLYQQKTRKLKGNTQTPPKTSITQRLWTGLGRSVGVTSHPTGVVKPDFKGTNLSTHHKSCQNILWKFELHQIFFLEITGIGSLKYKEIWVSGENFFEEYKRNNSWWVLYTVSLFIYMYQLDADKHREKTERILQIFNISPKYTCL